MRTIDERAAELSERLRAELGEIELRTMEYTLADAIREGATTAGQTKNWESCALASAVVAMKARGYA